MGERPLPDEVARAARAYLAALVSPSARADAWHDLLAEVRYWRDDQLVPVLRLAHQVVSQHERVTDEAAAHALADVGLTAVDDLAVVLHTDRDTARDLRERVDRAQESVGSVAASGSSATIAEDPATAVADPGVGIDSAPLDVTDTGSPSSAESPVPAAVRIGFDDQDPDEADRWGDDADDGVVVEDWDDDLPSGLLSYRRLVGIAVIVWLVVVVAWLLGGS